MECQPVNLSFVVLPTVRSVSFYLHFMSRAVSKRFENKNNRTVSRDVKSWLLMAEISTEHKYLRLSSKVHSPREPAGFINEPAEVFLSYIPRLRTVYLRLIKSFAFKPFGFVSRNFKWERFESAHFVDSFNSRFRFLTQSGIAFFKKINSCGCAPNYTPLPPMLMVLVHCSYNPFLCL